LENITRNLKTLRYDKKKKESRGGRNRRFVPIRGKTDGKVKAAENWQGGRERPKICGKRSKKKIRSRKKMFSVTCAVPIGCGKNGNQVRRVPEPKRTPTGEKGKGKERDKTGLDSEGKKERAPIESSGANGGAEEKEKKGEKGGQGERILGV